MKPYILVLTANFCFALGSMFFTHYARRFSSVWMNTMKASVAAIGFSLVVLFTTGFHELTFINFAIFFVSGFIALGIGDIFLIQAFAKLGPARTLVIFGFHPVIVGALSFIFFGQDIEQGKLIGIFFFICCLFTFSYEKFKSSGKWEISGLVMALAGMSLDAVGIPITRYAFDMNPSISGFEGNFYRCLGALTSYFIISRFRPFHFFAGIRSLSSRSLTLVITGSILGTFLSLGLYLEAIKTAHLASISGISITSVIFSSLFESIWEKKLPSKFLVFSFVFFFSGMYFILVGI